MFVQKMRIVCTEDAASFHILEPRNIVDNAHGHQMNVQKMRIVGLEDAALFQIQEPGWRVDIVETAQVHQLLLEESEDQFSISF